MARQLTHRVWVVNPKDGELVEFAAGVAVPAWAAKAIANPNVFAEDDGDEVDEQAQDDTGSDGDTDPAAGDGDDSGDDDGGSGYGAMTKPDLATAIEARNEGRDDKDLIVVGGKGNKPDLIAALEADDQAQA